MDKINYHLYVLTGEPTSLYMTKAIGKRIWDKHTEKKVFKEIEIRNQHSGSYFSKPLRIEIRFYLTKKRYKSYEPTLKSYINFVENILYGTIVKKAGQIFELDAKEKLSDTNPRTEIVITEVKL